MPTSKPASQAPPVPDYRSPEISPDGRVTLRYHHPSARSVSCEAEWNGWAPVPLHPDATGLWTCVSEPLPPDIYEYCLFADGARVVDCKNPDAKDRYIYFVQVPAPAPAIYEVRDVPHGTVHQHWYHSAITGGPRRMHVYTPPGYETEPSRAWPVLYLFHGSGDDDEGWIRTGRANFILDNLIAEGRALPMIVAMPNGQFFGEEWKENRGTKLRAFAADFYESVVPGVERLYRASATRGQRAMAGLSMGGGQTIFTGMPRPADFSAFGIFSAGLWPEVTPPLESALPALRETPPDLLWIGIGRRDFLYGHCTMFCRTLSAAGIPFTYHEDDTTHSWRAWRDYLERFAPLLFRQP